MAVNLNVTVSRTEVTAESTLTQNQVNVIGTKTQVAQSFRRGQTGLSAYEVWLQEGNSGTEAEFLASLKGDPGTGVLPAGGSTNQVLAKSSDADQDVGWVDQSVDSLDGGNF